MTITTIVSIYDNASKAYDSPRVFPSVGVAKRALIDMLRDNSSQPLVFRDHAEHFSMFDLGTFDTETGKISQHPTPELIANLWELRQQD